MEVRSGILYATAIIVLVFLPLFALPGHRGRLFLPLGIAFIVSTLASLLVSVTVGRCWLLPAAAHEEPRPRRHRVVAWLKARYRSGLVARALAARHGPGGGAAWRWRCRQRRCRSSRPPSCRRSTRARCSSACAQPGVTLAESSALARQAEVLVRQVPEVTHVGRRSGRAELDEHAEGVHVSELDVGLLPAAEMTRSMAEVQADIRSRLMHLPAAIAIGQPISHRIDHMLSGVRSQIAIKLFGDDLDTCVARPRPPIARGWPHPGLADLEVEKQVLAPQITVRVDYAAAANGVPAPQVLAALQTWWRARKWPRWWKAAAVLRWWCACPTAHAPSTAWRAC